MRAFRVALDRGKEPRPPRREWEKKSWGLCPQTPAAHTCQMDDPPSNPRNGFLKKVNGMGLGRELSLPSGVWGKAPRFSRKARGD